MTIRPQAATLAPERTIATLGGDFYDPVTPARFPETILRFRNDRWDKAVGLDAWDEATWLTHFGRFEPIAGSLPQPLALRYHGHQFRSYNPDIGDGRGFLFAQLRDGHGRLLDLGTKGSGQTPYSRFGDGRLTLKGGVREILATEMLEALGVETSKTFSIVETGEALDRQDEPSPTRGAAMVRLSHGHIRIGSFQRLAALGQTENVAKLVDYVLRELYRIVPGDDPAAQLLDLVVARTATMAASYMAAGFVHGVLNSDNINVTGESFDYGPWRFTPNWEPGFTAAYFDHQGLYAFARQPQAIHWDVVQLATALVAVSSEAALLLPLQAFAERYEAALRDALLARLGVRSRGDEADFALMAAIEEALVPGGVGIDRFFFDWRGGGRRAAPPADAVYGGAEFASFAAQVRTFEPSGALDHPYWADAAPCSMHIDEVEAIWSAIDKADDWAPLHAKVAAVRRMGDALRQEADGRET